MHPRDNDRSEHTQSKQGMTNRVWICVSVSARPGVNMQVTVSAASPGRTCILCHFELRTQPTTIYELIFMGSEVQVRFLQIQTTQRPSDLNTPPSFVIMDGRLLRLERPGSNGGYSTASWRIANHPGLRISDAQIPTTPPCILLQPGRDVDHLIDYLTIILNEGFGAENGWTLW